MESKGQPLRQSALQALTAAAMALPGLMHAPSGAAQDNAASFQFGRYQEGNRDLFGASSKYKPIEVDSLQSSAWFAVDDSLTAQFNFRQDTWTGATPFTTASR